jgi:hypothetical protein
MMGRYYDDDDDDDAGGGFEESQRWFDGRDEVEFAEPGANSALRAASASNPRNQPCPTCDWPNRLTPADVARGYQCNKCADACEGRGEIDYYEGED